MRRPIAALLLVLALLCGGTEHVHDGAATDGACTACQLERTTPTSPPIVAAPVEPPPIPHLAPAEPASPTPTTVDVLSVAPKTSPPRA